jgi:hypothetical protein
MIRNGCSLIRSYALVALLLSYALLSLGQSMQYPWRTSPAERTIASEIPPPEGFQHTVETGGSFATWLRNLPLKPEESPVLLYDGDTKANQNVHVAVIDIDTGKRDLQQCADAVIRLRAEYLYSRGRFEEIHFNFTSGDEASFIHWASGYRPSVSGNRVSWAKTAVADTSYSNFRNYLATVFMYAGSYSLSRELAGRRDPANIRIGDVFIQGGFPGHAVIVVDMAENTSTDEKVFLIAQSFMPAQDIHILKNPTDGDLSPWYRIPQGNDFPTPEWMFRSTDLKYFP